jgi:hypothetical protein
VINFFQPTANAFGADIFDPVGFKGIPLLIARFLSSSKGSFKTPRSGITETDETKKELSIIALKAANPFVPHI